MQKIINKLISLFFPVSATDQLSAINFSDKFIALSINNGLSDSISMDRVIQLEDIQGIKSQYTLVSESNEVSFKYYKKDKLVAFTQNVDYSLNENYTNKISEVFHFSIEEAKVILSNGSEVTSTIEEETKSLEWIKVSLVVLKSAIKKSLTDQSLLFNGQFFSGKRSVNDDFQMRIKCFSLDFLLEFLADGRLRVSVWNYKDQEHNSKVDPDFLGEFVKIKQSVFDEFIQLLVLMNSAATSIS
jgi:hypothetical protein